MTPTAEQQACCDALAGAVQAEGDLAFVAAAARALPARVDPHPARQQQIDRVADIAFLDQQHALAVAAQHGLPGQRLQRGRQGQTVEQAVRRRG